MKILGVDIGTTAMKMGVFESEGGFQLIRQFSRDYSINTYNDGMFSDIEPKKWKQAFINGCKAMGDVTADIDIISFSGTTPGLVGGNEQRGPSALSGYSHAGSALPITGPGYHQHYRIGPFIHYNCKHAGFRRLFSCQYPLDKRQPSRNL
jgi:hypothetical protein